MAGAYVLWSLLLLATLVWALYDEFIGYRPWKMYQAEFRMVYANYLKKEIKQQTDAENKVENSSAYLSLKKQVDDMQAQVQPQIDKINQQIVLLNAQFTAVNDVHTTRHMYVASRLYIIEHTEDKSDKASLQKDLDDYEKEISVVKMPQEGGNVEQVRLDYQQVLDQFDAIQAQKSKLYAQEGNLLHPVSVVKKQLTDYLADHLDGPDVASLQGLLAKAESLEVKIRQINNPDAGITDRCESCHIGIREPIPLTKADVGGNEVFVSHPDPELLQIHDPEKFGCSPCHNGNGMDAQSIEKAHGNYEGWDWPLFPQDNVEAGCQQCHARDIVVDHAPVLNQGKFLFEWRGCMGCHVYKGYDQSPQDLVANGRTINNLENEQKQDQVDVQRYNKMGDSASTNEEAQQDYLKANELQVAISQIKMQIDQQNQQVKWLMMDTKKVGPDLKEIGVKLNPNWLPVWIEDPQAFRPTTRMPKFPFLPGQVKAIAAFLWQDSIQGTLPKQAPGDAAKGKVDFESRGCMGCHSVGEGSNQTGGWFAANLSRVGEKANYDYLVRWIHNPRERTAPYCPYEKRDLTPEDYKKHGLPYVFDLEHDRCPNDGHILQVEQETVMPNLRLSWEESRDIASYLMTLKEKDPGSYEKVTYLDDPKLAAEGKSLIQFYGCGGCHEIAGFEDAPRIGTELTAEGSKSLDQIDFALFRRDALIGEKGWKYTHKNFFEHKLANPEIFDQGMIKAPDERLHMPNFHLKPQEITELTTFLLGSQLSQYPERYFYEPGGAAKDIQEGWWLVKKYNCEGCHQFKLGQSSVLMTLPQYQTPDGKSQLPPRLLTEGARVNPDWLAGFLSNPALSDTDTDRDGVRSYLKVRMPTFYLSPIEVRTLVRFFQALSKQPMPYIPQKLEPLTNDELAMARALFVSPGAPCLKCHAIGLPSHDQYATAPNFLLASERLKPDWVRHWILDPALIDPGTAMPSGLFKEQDNREVFAGPVPPVMAHYAGDEADLLVRYLLEITPAEQQRLIQMSGKMMLPASTKTSELKQEPRPSARKTLVGMLIKSH